MFDLREHKGLIRRLVSEANKNDANWHWSLKALSKTKASIFWSYLEYEGHKPCFVIELVEDDDGCLIVECVGLPRLNTPIDEAIKMMAYSIINTAHECY